MYSFTYSKVYLLRYSMNKVTTIGVISDTHGLMRPQAFDALQGTDIIIHAGDIGSLEVLDRLRSVAPVFAVRGNNDCAPWAKKIPLTEQVDIGTQSFYVLHEIKYLDFDPVAAEFCAVIYGHSHKPSAEYQKGVLYINPGSAGPRRFKLPVAVARLYVDGNNLEHEIVELAV